MLDGSQQDWARNQSVRAAASARADLTRSDTADELGGGHAWNHDRHRGIFRQLIVHASPWIRLAEEPVWWMLLWFLVVCLLVRWPSAKHAGYSLEYEGRSSQGKGRAEKSKMRDAI